MRSPLFVSLVLIAACGAPAAPPISNTSAPVLTGPVPTVAMRLGDDGDFGTTFTATGLPAIAADGKHVVVAVIGEDGARGAPNLALVERDRNDAVVRTVVVLTADEATMNDDAPVAPQAKLDAANQFLVELHGSRGLVALTPMQMVGSGAEDEMAAYGSPKDAVADGVTLRWDEGKIMVTDQRAKILVDRQTKGWTAPSRARCADCDVCSNPSFLAGAWIDRARQVIVARISYTGNDTCWEPDSQDHVIAW